MHTEVRFVEPVSASLKEENGGGLTSSSFGRLRWHKSPARVFWMSWIHWHYYQGHLKTSSSSFSPLKFQEALGSLKPSLMEDMFWWAYVCFLWLNNHVWLIIMLWTFWDRLQIHWRTFTGIFASFKLREAWRSHVEEVIAGWAIVHLQSFYSQIWGFYVFWIQWYSL